MFCPYWQDRAYDCFCSCSIVLIVAIKQHLGYKRLAYGPLFLSVGLCYILLYMVHILIELNVKKDAWNWWDGCNKVSHGVNWRERVDKDQVVLLIGKNREVGERAIMPYLLSFYSQHKKELDQLIINTQKIFDEQLDEAAYQMERLTQQPLYKKNFFGYLTTFPRGAYDRGSGSVWFPIAWSVESYLGLFLHELLHFQFIEYYSNIIEQAGLSEKQFNYLKESMTVILNSDFQKFLFHEDRGYELHKDLRLRLQKLWEEDKNFVRFLDHAITITKKTVM